MTNPEDELRRVFEFVRDNEWSSAREIGAAVEGGRSRANHFLYRYKNELFVKRGLTPPQWKVVSANALERLAGSGDVTPQTTPAARVRPRIFKRVAHPLPPRPMLDLPKIDICPSCDRPIQPTGRCGCA